jgi:CRP-like cAMP-binding protein
VKEIADLLREHPFTAGLEDSWIELIAGCAVNERVPAGAYMCREGQRADHFYLLRKGSIALEMHVPGRGPITLLTLPEGEILGVSWLVPPYRWIFDARALEGVAVLAFDAACLRDKCEADPALGYALMKRFVPKLVDRLRSAHIQSADVYGPTKG